jgi:hypothetical protein
VMFVTDAAGRRSQVAHHTAIERLSLAGAVPTIALAVPTDLVRDCATSFAGSAWDVSHYEVPKLTDEVGVAEAEKLVAAGAE